jgi:hypothetical protein
MTVFLEGNIQGSVDVASWHFADYSAALAFVRYWSNSGHWSVLALNG